MKKTLLLLILINLSSCTKEDITDKSSVEYAKSLNEWVKQKSENGNTYQYTVLSGSILGGYDETIITVDNGIPISREYNSYEGLYLEDNEAEYAYIENIDNLNTHNQGYEAIPFEEVYTDCSSNFLSKFPEYETRFKVDDNGLLNLCSYNVGSGCQDDCTIGISIVEFKWLNN